jgi:hypothetical protein
VTLEFAGTNGRGTLSLASGSVAVVLSDYAQHLPGVSADPVVIVLLAAGYFIGREYVNSRRFNRRNRT